MSASGLSPAAKQQGHCVSLLLHAMLTGKRPPLPFRYRHFGSLATIGRQSAVFEIGSLKIWGTVA
jgi:NADH dehydrogenase FAD-containing subunit